MVRHGDEAVLSTIVQGSALRAALIAKSFRRATCDAFSAVWVNSLANSRRSRRAQNRDSAKSIW